FFFCEHENFGRYANFLVNCAMDFHRKCWAYFYAVALSLWTAVIPMTAIAPPVVDALETASEKVSSYDQSNLVFLGNQNSSYLSISFRTDGGNPNIHFFNEGDFQFVFLKNIYATAFSIAK